MITMHRGMTAAQLQVLRSTGTVYSHREAVAMMAARAAYNRHMHGRPVDPEWIDKLERPAPKTPAPTPPATRCERAAARLALLDLTHTEPEQPDPTELASAGSAWSAMVRRVAPVAARCVLCASAIVMTLTLAACGGGGSETEAEVSAAEAAASAPSPSPSASVPTAPAARPYFNGFQWVCPNGSRTNAPEYCQ